MSNFVIWQKPTFAPHNTVDRSFSNDDSGQEDGVCNYGTPYPFKPSIDASTLAYGGTRVGQMNHDAYLRLIPFPKPPRLLPQSPGQGRGVNVLQNLFGASRAQGPGAPQGGR